MTTAINATSMKMEETLVHEYKNINLPQENLILFL